ncbi:hypothetical protein EGH21_21140 [Halomicroarcula sp. F13]|uniref:Transcriptional regulator n=1 Tax=Haloarcula rubra TaxID=2487747 RepID=A0AAW4PWH4_9EURY|nr:hypothetical protein [Halomicroarcula rubra]MBX0325534.1 hypothetical protein [Halomicroarcula rubra]
MTMSPDGILEVVSDIYKSTDRPVSTHTIAEAAETTPDRVTPVLNTLCRSEFVEWTESGVRPTVTGRQFLELDIELENVVVDVVDE